VRIASSSCKPMVEIVPPNLSIVPSRNEPLQLPFAPDLPSLPFHLATVKRRQSARRESTLRRRELLVWVEAV